jgi:GAF domain-containing protein
MVIDMDSSEKSAETRMLEGLASLNEIGSSINRFGLGEVVSVNEILHLIVESATKVMPGSAAILFAVNASGTQVDLSSRVSAGDWMPVISGDEPRSHGLGMRAIHQKRRVISYEESDMEIHPIKHSAGARTAVCYPMVVADVPVGILYVYLRDERHFSVMELLLLENFVNQAGMALAQTRRLRNAHQELERQEEELSQLRTAGLLISSRLRLDETLDTILQMALEVTGADYGIFRLVDKGNQNLVMRALAGEHLTRPLVEALPLSSDSVMAWVARNRQAVCIGDLKTEHWSEIYYPLDAELEMRSELAVPLIGASGRLEGVLNLESPEVNAFTERDRHLLQSLATQAVIAIQEARLLDALTEVTEMLLSKPYPDVLARLVDLAYELLNAVASAIWILEGDRLAIRASKGETQKRSLSLFQSHVGKAVLQREAVTIENSYLDPDLYLQSSAQAFEWKRALVVPLLSGSEHEPIGAFGVFGGSVENFANSDWDKKVLSSLAQYAAMAIVHATHESELRSSDEKRAVAEAFAAVGDISANLLHRLNNKVGTIPVRIQGIQEKCKAILDSEPYLAKNLDEIGQSARQALEVMRENLSYLNPIHLSSVDIGSCILEAVQEANLPPAISLQLIGLDHLPPVNAGRKGLVLVFSNLLQNAVEAMNGTGYITLHGMVLQAWVEIAVSDNGPGIAPELHERIFELNFSNRTGGADGKLGFGLWWVKTWMTRMGGTVYVESDGQHGATFRLRLPFARGSK